MIPQAKLDYSFHGTKPDRTATHMHSNVLLHGFHSLWSWREPFVTLFDFLSFFKAVTYRWLAQRTNFKSIYSILGNSFLSLCTREPGRRTNEAVFFAEMPRGCFRASGKQPSFQRLVVSGVLLLFLFVCFCSLTGAITLTQQLHFASSSTTNAFCTTVLSRPQW